MSQTQGSGTVYGVGPGTNFRGPLGIKGAPGNKGAQSFYPIFDSIGSLMAPPTGSVYREALIPIANAAVLTLHSAPALLLAAPGAGLLIDVDSVLLNYVYGTTQFASGGAIQASYGAGATAATGTVAATFLTSPTANQITKLAGGSGMSNILSSAALNTAIYLYAATGDFTTGDGSLVALIKYRIISGMK